MRNKYLISYLPKGRIRALEQETRDLDVENKQMKVLKARRYGISAPELQKKPQRLKDLYAEVKEEEAGSIGEPTMEECMGKNAFNGTNGEEAVEHIENFLEVIDLIKVPKLSNNQIRVCVFPFSLTGAASKWWDDDSIRNPDNFEFAQWLASKFRNHEKMDWHTKNTLWAYWKRGDDEEVIRDDEVPKGENLTDEDEIAQIFRIDIYFTLRLLFQCEDDWIYERNKGIPWVEEKPWTSNEEWTELMRRRILQHWNLPGLIHESNSIRYKNYEWYDTIKDIQLNEEALNNKRVLKESMDEKEDSSDDERSLDSRRSKDKIVQDEMELNNDEGNDMGHLDDHLVYENEPFIINMKEEGFNKQKWKPLGIPFTRPPGAKLKGLRSQYGISINMDTAYRLPVRF
ncbi:hypothetical protein Tco_0319010 [Tanacetum coccineum]